MLDQAIIYVLSSANYTLPREAEKPRLDELGQFGLFYKALSNMFEDTSGAIQRTINNGQLSIDNQPLGHKWGMNYFPYTTLSLQALELDAQGSMELINDLFQGLSKHIPMSPQCLEAIKQKLTELAPNVTAKKEDGGDKATPAYLCCPLTGKLFDNPVTFTLDGCSYSRAALLEHLQQHKTCPGTGIDIPSLRGHSLFGSKRPEDFMIVNHSLADIIEAMQKSPA